MRNMIRSTRISAAAAIALAIGATAVLHAEDAPKPQMPPEQMAMMEAFQKHATPGPQHEKLAKMAGEWTAKSTGYMPDGSTCAEGTGMMSVRAILGGRFIEMSYKGEMSGPMGKMPFEGRGVIGYDNSKQKYVNIWMDSFSTSMMTTEGTEEGNVTTLTGEAIDPMTGKPSKVKEIATHVDDTHHKYELHMTGPDGKLFKCIEVMYTKR